MVSNPERKRVRPEFITEDLKFSLENMATDDPAVPVGKLIDTLEEHKKAGCSELMAFQIGRYRE